MHKVKVLIEPKIIKRPPSKPAEKENTNKESETKSTSVGK